MIDLILSDPRLKAGSRFEENCRQGNIPQTVTLGQLVAVQELDLAAKLFDKLFPLVAHLESRMGNSTEVTAVGLRRNDFVADVEQRVHQPAVGVVDKDEDVLAHFGAMFRSTRPHEACEMCAENLLGETFQIYIPCLSPHEYSSRALI